MTSPACGEVREAIVAWLDGELTPAEATRVAEHLDACEACAAERAAHEAAWKALDSLEPVAARPGWLQEVEREILAAPAPGGVLLRFPIWAAAAAAAVLLAVGLALFAGPTPTGGAVAVQPGPEAPVVQPGTETGTDLSETELATGPEGGTLSTDELALVLPPEDVEMVRDLEVLVMLAELEDADLLESLDILVELDEEEFDES